MTGEFGHKWRKGTIIRRSGKYRRIRVLEVEYETPRKIDGRWMVHRRYPCGQDDGWAVMADEVMNTHPEDSCWRGATPAEVADFEKTMAATDCDC